MARPLFFHFNEDPSIYAIDKQFLLGQSVLVSPVLTPNTTEVKAYFPAGTWYNLFDYSQLISNGDKGSYHTVATPMDTINVHVHEGSILPLQEAALTTVAARKTPFTLVIAFSMKQGGEDAGKAEGALFLDNGEDVVMGLESGKSTFVKFNASRNERNYGVESVVKEGSFALKNGWVLQKIVVLGTSSVPRRLLVNGREAAHTVQVNKASRVSLVISGLGLAIGRPFTLHWTV